MKTEQVTRLILSKDNRINKIINGDLFSLLSICDEEDLDPIVKILRSDKSSLLTRNEKYKKHYPHHSNYFELIENEVRLYGGNSLANVYRKGIGPEYIDIIEDVCKRLKIPIKKNNVNENEKRILKIFFEKKYDKFQHKMQLDFINKGIEIALGEIGESRDYLVLGKGLSKGIPNPSYKVLVPCVMHIAYIRKKFFDILATFSSTPDNKSKISFPISLNSIESPKQSLTIYNDQNKPTLSMAWVSEPDLCTLQPLHKKSITKISKISPLFQAVPNLATVNEMKNNRYMMVVGDLTFSSTNGYYIGKSPNANGSPLGKFAELFEPEKLTNLITASAFFQIASLAVAQKHLSDIKEKLTEIQQSVDSICNFQKNERRSIISGSINYFKQVSQAIFTGEIEDTIRNMIEQHEIDLLRIQDHLTEDIRQVSRDILDIKDNSLIGSKSLQDSIQQYQEMLYELFQQVLLCIRARACGWQLLAAFPGEERLKESRKQSIIDSLDSMKEDGGLLGETGNVIRQKIQRLSSFFDFGATLNTRKLSLLEWNETLVAHIKKSEEQITNDFLAADAIMNNRRQPIALILKIQEDQVVDAYVA